METLKALILRKMKLMNQWQDLDEDLRKLNNFFAQKIPLDPANEKEKFFKAVTKTRAVTRELEVISREIRDMDTLIVAELETQGGYDFGVKLPERINEAGDIVSPQEIILTVKEDLKKHPMAISTDDLWTVILLREMYRVNNVEVRKR